MRRSAGRTAAVAAMLLAGVAAAVPSASAQDDLGTCMAQEGVRYSSWNGWAVPDVMLRQGSTGVCVRALQEALITVGYVHSWDVAGFVDGDFGPKTLDAVLRWQASYPTATGGADGVVGDRTWGYLLASAQG
ncbi:peptidoglycan-binding protein [Streptomyces sp. ISL-66]|uniref:peptidoglycan-binding domain-containing protein n=1 Tax=Streptomyces sp. ISL-66 TaxID=2819186 RepID=UPI001BE7AEB6|nr:peptidoglycan-binding protein [Streptomyces sp. ISL-66]MBT2471842.1 peptidoglycan-binding protein [Streptomyces sp. ISL-66]